MLAAISAMTWRGIVYRVTRQGISCQDAPPDGHGMTVVIYEACLNRKSVFISFHQSSRNAATYNSVTPAWYFGLPCSLHKTGAILVPSVCLHQMKKQTNRLIFFKNERNSATKTSTLEENQGWCRYTARFLQSITENIYVSLCPASNLDGTVTFLQICLCGQIPIYTSIAIPAHWRIDVDNLFRLSAKKRLLRVALSN